MGPTLAEAAAPAAARYPHNPDSTASIIARSPSANSLPVDLFGHLPDPLDPPGREERGPALPVSCPDTNEKPSFGGAMSETRKLAAILVADVVGYSRLAGADEDRTLARLRGLRSDLIDPTIAAHHGRIVKRTGDGSIIEFRSVVDAVRCALEVQTGMVERNAGLPPERASSSASAFISATSSKRRTVI